MGALLYRGKLSFFVDPLEWLDDGEAAIAAAAGYYPILCLGDLSGLAGGGTVDIQGAEGTFTVRTGGVGVNIVNRGDPGAADFNAAALTQDNAWHDLNLSAIVASGATWVLIAIALSTGLATYRILFRKKGNVNEFAIGATAIPDADGFAWGQAWVPLDASGFCQYKVTTAMTVVNLTVMGWVVAA